MRRLVGSALAAVVLLAAWTPPASAGTSTDIALGLASFAVFNQVVGPLLRPAEAAYHRREVVVTHPAVVYQTPVVYATPVVVSPPPYPTVVQYPHGRYELRLQGQQYVWVWIPNVPPPPPAPPAPPTP